ncbi:TY-Chap2 family putative peptide chaperone [Gryllotalpicola ginsengisoli]|uniref:TY-Chap2 family putative peptide chaperone n=1 Tax=Gryllotalpicola ginsengisoli TaxID=444608 RepID=UPI0003B53EEF|nr:hypothetical protein [Gryllotalpicola ginsengisoli]
MIADRFTLAQTWWVASELVRRHPRLMISRRESEGAPPVLLVHDEGEGMKIGFDLSTAIQFLAGGVLKRIEWAELFGSNEPLQLVRRIELESGLGIVATAPPMTERSVVYRLIAKLLALGVDDRYTWHAVSLPGYPTAGAWAGMTTDAWNRTVDPFPGAVGASLGYYERSSGALRSRTVLPNPFWALMRDVDTVAILDVAGHAYLRTGSVDLLATYRGTGNSLARTAVLAFGDWLV